MQSRTTPGGETGAALRAFDWSGTCLGPYDQWPALLRSSLSLMLNSPESLYLVWGDDLMFFFNDAYRPILGSRLPEAMGKSIVEVWPDAWPQVRPLVEDAFAGRTCRFEDLPIDMARGGQPERTWWSFSYSPIYDETESTVLGVLCHTEETTHNMLTRQQLRESQAFNSRVLACSNDCIKVLDLDGCLRFMSEGGMRVMEVTDFSQIEGCPWPDFWQELGNHHARAALDDARAGLAARFQGSARTMLGNLRWWDVEVTPMLDADGRPEKILCISRDITATREAEEELRALNARLEERIEARTQDRDRIWRLSTDLILVADYAGRIVEVNPAWTQVLGWSPEDLVDTEFNGLVHPDDECVFGSGILELASGCALPGVKSRYRHRDGSYRWISWTAVPDQNYIHAVGRDIHDEREAERLLRKTEEALRHSQKLEAVGQLTGGVAHDFNNLLTVIKSSTDLLKRSLDEDRRRRYIDAISDTADRASKLTGQLLAFARQQALRPEVFDVGASVRSISEMIGTLTGARIKLTIEVAEQACYINADAGQFDTALVNMAVNARDAMNGEGTLSIRIAAVDRIPAVDGAAHSGDFVAVTIGDTGSGIDRHNLERIFEPFFTTKEVGKGTGLGLSQVFGFVKQSGGELTVDSRPGRGTEFTLYLPRTHELPAPAAAVPEVSDHDGRGARILVVEDNLQVGEFSTQTLADLGYSIQWAVTASEALDILARQPQHFQAVFSDVVMPGMNGVELAREIRRRHPHLPVILTSGYSPALVQGDTQGFTFLQKPYSVDSLASIVSKAMRGTPSA